MQSPIAGQHRALPDAGHRRHRGFHLTQLDAVTADLDLVVGAPEEVEVAVGAPADQVAGAVQPAPVRAGHEARRRQRGPVQVPPGQARPGNVELPRHPRRHGPEPAVEHVADGVEDGLADGGCGAAGRTAAQGVDRVFGGAVEVVAGDAVGVAQGGPQLFGHRFAAQQHQAGPVRAVEQALIEQGLGVGGREVDDVHLVLGAVRDQRPAVAPQLLVGDVHVVAFDQPQQLLPGHVEGEADGVRDGQNPPTGRRDSGVEDGLAMVELHVRQPAVRCDDTLGPAGGARGVDDVRGPVQAPGGARREVLHPRLADLVVQPGQRVEHEHRPGVVDHGLPPLLRQVEVERQVRGSGAQHGEQRDDHVDAAGQGQADDRFRSGAAVPQPAGDRADPAVEFGVTDRGAVMGQRGRRGGARGLLGQHLRNGCIGNASRNAGLRWLVGEGPSRRRNVRVEPE